MDTPSLSTREKIIEAAIEVFGANGFKGSTIRVIADLAEVNVAAVNYHFGGKKKLYGEVVETVFSRGFSRYPSISSDNFETALTVEKRLFNFIKGAVYRLVSRDGWGGFSGAGKIVVKEMLEPTEAFDVIVDRYIRPHKAALVLIVKELAGDNVPEKDLLFCSMSILGQCINYASGKNIIGRVMPEGLEVEDHIDEIVEHVYMFSLGGIDSIRKKYGERT